MHFEIQLLNVGPSCCILVPIHNVSCFLAFYTTNRSNPTSHSISQREIFLSTCVSLIFFPYHAKGLVINNSLPHIKTQLRNIIVSIKLALSVIKIKYIKPYSHPPIMVLLLNHTIEQRFGDYLYIYCCTSLVGK